MCKANILSISISPNIKAKVRNLAVGWLTANVHIAEHNDFLWYEIEAAANRFRGMTMTEVRKFPLIIGPVGSTTSDSERTTVRLETTKILMVIISFGGRN